jgi:cytochrome c biogenesis factor
MLFFFTLYIDPGIGSLAVQVLVAGFAAFMMFFKNGFKRFFSRSKKDDSGKDNSTLTD